MALALIGAGCQRSFYRASSLPPQLQAPPHAAFRPTDLTRLAGAGVGNELIYTGDVLNVSMATGLETEAVAVWPLRVGENGAVQVPLVGPVQVAGLQLTDAERLIRDESIRRRIYRNPQVAVSIEQRRSNRVTVVGAVEEPGVYEVPVASSDLLSALVQAGGLSEDAGTIVEVRNPGTPSQSIAGRPFGAFGETPQGAAPAAFVTAAQQPLTSRRINLSDPSALNYENMRLNDGAVVNVNPRPLRAVYVMGLVQDPGQYEIPENEDLRLLDAIALAGGRQLQLADDVQITRTDPRTKVPEVIKASIRAAKRDGVSNIRLAAGDLVSVEETPVTFAVQTVRDFVRFGFSSAIPGT